MKTKRNQSQAVTEALRRQRAERLNPKRRRSADRVISAALHDAADFPEGGASRWLAERNLRIERYAAIAAAGGAIGS